MRNPDYSVSDGVADLLLAAHMTDQDPQAVVARGWEHFGAEIIEFDATDPESAEAILRKAGVPQECIPGQGHTLRMTEHASQPALRSSCVLRDRERRFRRSRHRQETKAACSRSPG